MRTINDKLNSLTANSVWAFAKQEIDFVKAFKAVKIFKMIPPGTDKVEEFFKNNSRKVYANIYIDDKNCHINDFIDNKLNE